MYLVPPPSSSPFCAISPAAERFRNNAPCLPSNATQNAQSSRLSSSYAAGAIPRPVSGKPCPKKYERPVLTPPSHLAHCCSCNEAGTPDFANPLHISPIARETRVAAVRLMRQPDGTRLREKLNAVSPAVKTNGISLPCAAHCAPSSPSRASQPFATPGSEQRCRCANV